MYNVDHQLHSYMKRAVNNSACLSKVMATVRFESGSECSGWNVVVVEFLIEGSMSNPQRQRLS